MLSTFKSIFSKRPTIKKNDVIKCKKMKNKIFQNGFAVANIENDKLIRLKNIYEQNHSINNSLGGMFYSVYAQNTEYRKKIHLEIEEVVHDNYHELFLDYKVVLNSFIIKSPGNGSEFQPHQDSTGLDETKHSPLSVWIPLEDVDEKNGCIFLIPKSHHLAPIYRGISMKPNFDSIKNEIKKYFIPITLRKGEILIFLNFQEVN